MNNHEIIESEWLNEFCKKVPFKIAVSLFDFLTTNQWKLIKSNKGHFSGNSESGFKFEQINHRTERSLG